MADVEVKSNLDEFLIGYTGDLERVLYTIGATVLQAINDETPVKSGAMKKANHYKIEGTTVTMINDATNEKGVHYPSFVELGTFVQAPNPFMRRGIQKSANKIISEIASGLKV